MKKIVIWVKYGNVFTQILMFSLKKVDDFRAREQEGEKKEQLIPRLKSILSVSKIVLTFHCLNKLL